MNYSIRNPRRGEAEALTALALRGKAHWGYDPAFVEACRGDIRLTDDYVLRAPIGVAHDGPSIVGFYGFSVPEQEKELVHLWIEPGFIGTGLGRALWDKAVEHARSLGWDGFKIVADPNAAGFYERMGARLIRHEPSKVDPKRQIPIYFFAR